MSVNLTEGDGVDYYSQVVALLQAGREQAGDIFAQRAENVRLNNLIAGKDQQIEILGGANTNQKDQILKLRTQVERLAYMAESVHLLTGDGTKDFDGLNDDMFKRFREFDINKELEDCGCGTHTG